MSSFFTFLLKIARLDTFVERLAYYLSKGFRLGQTFDGPWSNVWWSMVEHLTYCLSHQTHRIYI
jgi:hypothetical protein